jgi:hypothetical protein
MVGKLPFILPHDPRRTVVIVILAPRREHEHGLICVFAQVCQRLNGPSVYTGLVFDANLELTTVVYWIK